MEGSGSSNWRKFRRLKPSGKRIGSSARKIEKATVRHAHKFIVSRYENIKNVKRHALGWLVAAGLLIVLSVLQFMALGNSYTAQAEVDGGVYAEGVIGQMDVINPLFSSTPAERSASRLIYSGLLSYDESGSLQHELAESWKVERDGLRYVVALNPAARWHDGEKVTADDVMFTLELMRNPIVRAMQQQSWSGVGLEKIDEYTISFELPRAYAAFPHALTFGILPKHIFSEVAPESMRESELNRNPVGSGPFMFSRLQVIDPDLDRMVVYMNAFRDYIHDEPRVERFQLHTFADSEKLREAFVLREVNAASGLGVEDTSVALSTRQGSQVIQNGLDHGVYAFFNFDSAAVKDKSVRQALLQAVDREALIEELGGNALPLGGPLMPDQVSDVSSQFTKFPYALDKAEELLAKAGWKKDNAGKLVKDGRPLSIRLVGIDAEDYPKVVTYIKESWEALGVTVEYQLAEADTIQQNIVVPRAYDVLVYELEIGADPDVYAFWHSSQAGPRGLNLSNYKSDISSEALESAQSRFEMNVRTPKYEAFNDQWVEDIPAVALYQPVLGYITSDTTRSVEGDSSLPSRINRYGSVHHWTVNELPLPVSR